MLTSWRFFHNRLPLLSVQIKIDRWVKMCPETTSICVCVHVCLFLIDSMHLCYCYCCRRTAVKDRGKWWFCTTPVMTTLVVCTILKCDASTKVDNLGKNRLSLSADHPPKPKVSITSDCWMVYFTLPEICNFINMELLFQFCPRLGLFFLLVVTFFQIVFFKKKKWKKQMEEKFNRHFM